MVRAAVLAAGEGTRIRSTLSKLFHLHPISSKALVGFAVRNCIESGIRKPIIIVGHQAEELRFASGKESEYIYQEKELSTGDVLKQVVLLLGVTRRH